MDKKPLPIGVDDFRNLITNRYNYVDKTLLIKELWQRKDKVTLLHGQDASESDEFEYASVFL